ncbi:hypothetical protein [Nostoc sp.]|uniref:hypothetical protein n=1 Tax=Nostoc sp. TaxID=1180 RepID=UPI002FFC8533
MLENHLKIWGKFGNIANLPSVLMNTNTVGIGRKLGYSQNNFQDCQQQLIKEICSHA